MVGSCVLVTNTHNSISKYDEVETSKTELPFIINKFDIIKYKKQHFLLLTTTETLPEHLTALQIT